MVDVERSALLVGVGVYEEDLRLKRKCPRFQLGKEARRVTYTFKPCLGLKLARKLRIYLATRVCNVYSALRNDKEVRK